MFRGYSVLVLLSVVLNFSNGQKVFAVLSVLLSKAILADIKLMAGTVLLSDVFGSSCDYTYLQVCQTACMPSAMKR
jgi:hypothetical protein